MEKFVNFLRTTSRREDEKNTIRYQLTDIFIAQLCYLKWNDPLLNTVKIRKDKELLCKNSMGNQRGTETNLGNRDGYTYGGIPVQEQITKGNNHKKHRRKSERSVVSIILPITNEASIFTTLKN